MRMPSTGQKRTAGLLALACLAAGCSGEAERQASTVPERSVRAPVSPEVKRAAAALSLSGIGSLKEGTDYARAVNCAAALGALEAVIQLGAIGEAEANAVKRAGAHFRARAGELRVQESKSQQQFTADLEREQAELVADPGSAGQTALACLRSLAV